MKAHLSILILLLNFNFTLGQTDSLTITGYVCVSTITTTPIQNAVIKLRQDNGITYTTLSSSDGTYMLKAPTSTVGAVLYITTIAQTQDKMNRRNDFVSLTPVNIKSLTGSALNCNFKMDRGCFYGPEINFRANSTNFSGTKQSMGMDSLSYEEGILNMYILLAENPGAVLEIGGHCDSQEKDPKKLSLLRAESIKTILVKRQINEKRLSVKGYGASQLLIPNVFIKTAETPAEKETLHTKNRRVSFKTLRMDFKE